jgi:putative ABC transport system substrate-binding protein
VKPVWDNGALISYGPRTAAGFHRAIVCIDKILKGARPADLPIEQPRKFELVIDLRTSRAIGIEVPPMVLSFADEIME